MFGVYFCNEFISSTFGADAGVSAVSRAVFAHAFSALSASGDCNLIGKTVEKLRKERKIKQKDFIARLQVFGLDINPTSYSKLEGQVRIATDKEVYAIAKVLGVEMEELYK